MVYGVSGHASRPSGGVAANYQKCYPDTHVKAIVNTKRVKGVADSHSFTFKRGYYAVDTIFS